MVMTLLDGSVDDDEGAARVALTAVEKLLRVGTKVEDGRYTFFVTNDACDDGANAATWLFCEDAKATTRAVAAS